MGKKIDLHIVPMYRLEGKSQPYLPGLFVVNGSRRAVRSRKGDVLLLHLALTGTATISPDGQTQVLEKLAETYFQTSGAVTSALRSLADELNQFLLNRNLSASNAGLQATGLLTCVVLHNEHLYLTQSGPNHVFTIQGSETEHLFDPALSGQGLGLGRTAGIRFTHTPVSSGDLLILTPEPPAAWTAEALKGAAGRSLATIHRVLTRAGGDELNAVMIFAREGRGSHFQILDPAKLEGATDSLRTTRPQPAAEAPVKTPIRTENAPVRQQSPAPRSSQPPAASQPQAQAEPPPPPKPRTPQPTSSLSTPVQKAAQAPVPKTRKKSRFQRQIGQFLRALLTRLLPGNELFTLPGSLMAIIAIAVPVILVTVASVVYLRRGRLVQFDEYFNQAQATALYAETQSDPNDLRISWGSVVFFLDRAEELQQTEETQALREKAFTALNDLDAIERLVFRPALQGTALGENVRITRIVASREEVYLLDGNSGNVIRTWLSGRGYEIDENFRCGPGSYGSYIVSKLVDVELMPRNNLFDAAVVAMDENGILVYCGINAAPIADPLIPPDSNWGEPIAFSLNSGNLYVLDPALNAVQVYTGNNTTFENSPDLFFDEQVPQMQDVIDLTVDLDDLYLLHEDGRMTVCTAGFAGQPTKCDSPAPYQDNRPGMEDGVTINDTDFRQLYFSPPPDPSIYLLDTNHNAIYHLSLRLTLQRQFRPVDPLIPDGEAATAFTINPTRTLFVAVGNELFTAALP
jgi:hypothetical protein